MLETWKRFWREEDAVGVVEIILILVVLIALVLVFKNQITSMVTSAFTKAKKDAGGITK